MIPIFSLEILSPSLQAATCDYTDVKAVESTEKSAVSGVTYRRDDSPWVVVADSDSVTISSAKTKQSCKAEVPQVSSVYWGKNIIVVESGNAVEDYLTFLNATTCKGVKKSVQLPVDEKKRKDKLRFLKICE